MRNINPAQARNISALIDASRVADPVEYPVQPFASMEACEVTEMHGDEALSAWVHAVVKFHAL
jgi:hypothetical protein